MLNERDKVQAYQKYTKKRNKHLHLGFFYFFIFVWGGGVGEIKNPPMTIEYKLIFLLIKNKMYSFV